GKKYLGDFLVFHQEFEDGVVNGIGDDSHIAYSLIIKQIYFFYLINERMKRLNSSIGKELWHSNILQPISYIKKHDCHIHVCKEKV
ncbi:hypothetical protein, partial [Bacteroides congonensis]